MTLQEALQENVMIKRASWEQFAVPQELHYTFEDVTADDWETRRLAVMLTRQYFFHKLAECIKEDYGVHKDSQSLAVDNLLHSTFFSKFADRLGL